MLWYWQSLPSGHFFCHSGYEYRNPVWQNDNHSPGFDSFMNLSSPNRFDVIIYAIEYVSFVSIIISEVLAKGP